MVPVARKNNTPKDKNDFKAKEVTYINKADKLNLSGLSEADIIFECINSIGQDSYKAIFTKNIPKNIKSSLKVKYKTIKYIPKFNFQNKDGFSDKYTISAKSIYINLNNLCSSNFIYNGKYYIHYRDTVQDIDKNNNSLLPLANIIVQFIDKGSGKYNIETDIGNGGGYLFTSGRGIQIKWNKEDTNPIKFTDLSNNPIYLNPGLTWWIFLDKNSSIIIK